MYGTTFDVIVIAGSVRPWKALSKTITAGRPVATRAILTAFSTASAPRFNEDRLLVVAAARRELGEPAAHLDVGLVHPDHEALVHVAVDLGVHRVDDRGEVVAEVRAAEPAGEVDVLAALDVPDPRALGALDDERRSGDATGDVALAGLLDAIGGAPLLQRHGTRLYCYIRRRPRSSDPRRRLAPWPSG